jgi:hypothetical protein
MAKTWMRGPAAIVWLSLAGALGGAPPAMAQGEPHRSPLPDRLPLGADACFGRSYDAAHLKRHPRQRITSLHLLRDFTPDRSTEFVPQTVEEMKKHDGQYGNVTVSAFVRFRDRPGAYWNMLSCHRSGEGAVRCGVDCDGGSFGLKPLAKGDGLMLENYGFVVVGGCGSDDDEKEVFVHPGADDKMFRLDRQPVAACLAMRDAVRPAWVKLGSYDAAHLAKHPQQTVRRFAVLKAGGDKPGEDAEHKLSFRIELKDGRKIEKQAKCFTERYAYTCNPAEPVGSEADFYLTRAGDAAAMVRDRKGHLSKLFGATLGSDDRMFRLNAADPKDCAL